MAEELSRDRALRLAKALLAKTVENGCTAEEASAAAAKASEFIETYRLEAAELGENSATHFGMTRGWVGESVVMTMVRSFGPIYVTENVSGKVIGNNNVGDIPTMNDYDTTYDRYLEKSGYVGAPPYDERTARQVEEVQG